MLSESLGEVSQILLSITSHPYGPGRVGVRQVGTWSGLVLPSGL